MKARWELTFVGAAIVRAYRIPRHRRWHPTLEAAEQEAGRVYERMVDLDINPAAHTAIVYGPGGKAVTIPDTAPIPIQWDR